eukprot:Platyproteum_vivax@DN5840_c0_g1_i2.p1
MEARAALRQILKGSDDRLAVIVGPCSIHDPKAALEYANKLAPLIKELAGELVIVMRAYFEKPRTTVGWKGFINDPDMDDGCNINKGLRLGRNLLIQINDLGVPTGCELLDTTTPQYISDVVSWGAVGARTTESQLHRQLASGSGFPIGFKNGTSGDVQVAVDACKSSFYEHNFLGITGSGLAAVVSTKGNPDCHVILRGGKSGPNYSDEDVKTTVKMLEKSEVATRRIIVDCSHANSDKDFRKQGFVLDALCVALSKGESNVAGVMVESCLEEGSQSIPKVQKPAGSISHLSDAFVQSDQVLKQLKYGVSVTDACVGWGETVQMLQKLSKTVAERRKQK